jgi:hypothetical protein
LRHIKQGLPLDELVANDDVVAQVEDLGLLADDARLIPEIEELERVEFIEANSEARFSALVQGQRLVSIERLAQ